MKQSVGIIIVIWVLGFIYAIRYICFCLSVCLCFLCPFLSFTHCFLFPSLFLLLPYSLFLSLSLSLSVISHISVSVRSRSPFMNDLVTITPDGVVAFVSCTSSPEVTYINKYFVFVDTVCLFLIPLCIIVVCYSKV